MKELALSNAGESSQQAVKSWVLLHWCLILALLSDFILRSQELHMQSHLKVASPGLTHIRVDAMEVLEVATNTTLGKYPHCFNGTSLSMIYQSR